MKYLYIVLTFILAFPIHAQKKHYDYPFYGTEAPLTLRIKIILLQREDGSGNFDLKNEEEKAVITDFIENGLKGYQNFVQPKDLTGCYDGLDFISDAKIRFDYEFIEIRDTYAWDYRNSGTDPEKKKLRGFSPTENWYLKNIDDSLRLAHKNKQGIHIYFTNNGNNFDEIYANKCQDCIAINKAAGQFPTSNNFQRTSQVHMPDIYIKYLFMRYKAPKEQETTWEKDIRNWFVHGDAITLRHELGHNFGLGHSNEYHGANKCKYTMMSQKYTHPRNYLQPTEIRKIHYNLSSTNLMQFVTPESHYGTTIKLYSDQEWKKKRRYYTNFEIAKKTTLTITEPIIMPLNSTIKLNKKAKIIFKGNGKITYPDGKEFCGWKLHRRAEITHQ